MTDAPQSIEHQWSDAWLLVAATLASSKAPASLSEVIAAADAVQHAVPEFDEIDGGFARLSAANLLRRGPHGFALTERGAELIAQTPSGGWLTKQMAIEKALTAAPWSATYAPADARRGSLRPVVARDEYRAAVEGYSKA